MGSHASGLERVARSLFRALADDPFYATIAADFAESKEAFETALVSYFEYSMTEAEAIGRLVTPAGEYYGAALWLLPTSAELRDEHGTSKQAFLRNALGPGGLERYRAMTEFMSRQSAGVVPGKSWYLSIVAVAPEQQGQRLGEKLLQPTLAEADAAGATCYLETFSTRNVGFYARLGFDEMAVHTEPTTGEDYRIMVRAPGG